MLLFRLALIGTFFLIIGRLFQLQVIQGDTFQSDAADNRYKLIEVAAPRGVIYDSNGQILVRNQPSFEIAIVPEDLPFDDLNTAEDEETVEITKVLMALGADTDRDVALGIAELMFRRLGRADFAAAVEGAGVPLKYNRILASSVLDLTPEQANEGEPQFIDIPDITEPLPLAGLVALVQSLVSTQKLGNASQPIPILGLVDRIKALQMTEESYRLPSVRVQPFPARRYIYQDLMSQILGFMGVIPREYSATYQQEGYTDLSERVGYSGLEYAYQRELRGVPGYKYIEKDILGREMRTVGQVLEPVPGSNLILNVDRRLQTIMRDTLQAQMDEVESKWGVSIAMNPQNGAVLGLVTLPSFDNNIFAERVDLDAYQALVDDERLPLINYAIGGLYPPGSTFKLVTALGALTEGVITKETQIVDTGPLLLPNQFFPDDLSQAQPFVSWNHLRGFVHGSMNIVDGLALSNDIFFYWIGGGYPRAEFRGLGNKGMVKWAELMGYGVQTGIDLPGEVGAIIPDDQWKRQLYAESWTTGDSYNMSIGQGFVLATPLQVLVSTAAIANGGTVYAPQVVYQIRDAEDGLQRDFTPKAVRQLPASAEDIRTVQEGMWAVVNGARGTGAASQIEGVTVAGKTGTAEFCEIVEKEDNPEEKDCRRNDKGFLPTHAWYVAYAPYENPEIAIVTFVYNGGEGSAVALPVTKTILEAYFNEIRPRQVASSN
jgi:penicillin-binding protein 2